MIRKTINKIDKELNEKVEEEYKYILNEGLKILEL